MPTSAESSLIGQIFPATGARSTDLLHAIYKYTRDEEKNAVTLSQSTRSCGRILFRTGIPDIYIALIEDHEPFLEKKIETHGI